LYPIRAVFRLLLVSQPHAPHETRASNSRHTVKTFTPLPGGGLSITWDTQAGKTYRVERSTSLAPNQWTTLQDDVQGDGTQKSFTDNNPGVSSHLFYRIAVSPLP
jgi:hypothetical protein